MTLPWILVLAGGGINVIDAFTAKGDPAAGFFYGSSGILKPVNDALPINIGLILMLLGAAWIAWRAFK